MLKLLHFDENFSLESLSPFEIFLSEERLLKIENISNKTQKVRSFLTELFVKYNIHAETGINLEDINFQFGEFGKPYLSGVSDYFFSVSHTNNAIVFASSKAEIGVDIEENLPRNKKTPTKFLTENEASHIENSLDKNSDFYKIWTAKEAFVKKTGEGFHRSFKSFDVLKAPISDSIFTTEFERYIISVCYENKLTFSEIQDYTCDEILSFFRLKRDKMDCKTGAANANPNEINN